ncbi:hypothetical protein ZHAS_00012512 [Anopheles sinensis]|uniref:Uncharacterized protein n=1 Tax=Anopheles sinensis TaxID=74873 RepID=A0A084W334_ANOSI|nr:hypothetical protein ZHAS_00012512 [Anopheles sinensis]
MQQQQFPHLCCICRLLRVRGVRSASKNCIPAPVTVLRSVAHAVHRLLLPTVDGFSIKLEMTASPSCRLALTQISPSFAQHGSSRCSVREYKKNCAGEGVRRWKLNGNLQRSTSGGNFGVLNAGQPWTGPICRGLSAASMLQCCRPASGEVVVCSPAPRSVRSPSFPRPLRI